MKGILVFIGTATALPSICMSSVRPPPAVDIEYLEPNVQRHVGVLPPSVCKRLIDLGEKSGFLVVEESIDAYEQRNPDEKFVPSQTIDVYARGIDEGDDNVVEEVENEAIWDVLQPVIPRIADIVKANRDEDAFAEYYPDEPDREPELNWVFFRKYSPNDERNSLSVHHDTNMNTVNIELNDDYRGGGLLYLRPLASTGETPDEYRGGYEWIDNVKRENTTDIIFPDLRAGDAIFYNYTVEHGVAPVESGARYSMAFFFDMDNPAVMDDFDDLDAIQEDEFRVELYNAFLSVDLDVYLVYDAAEEIDDWICVFEAVTPGERTIYHAYEGDILKAYVAGTEKLVADMEVNSDGTLCAVYQIGSNADLFQIDWK